MNPWCFFWFGVGLALGALVGLAERIAERRRASRWER